MKCLKQVLRSLILLIVIVPTLASAATSSSVPPHFLLTGSGFGHGVGMSQIGALGQAMEGESSEQILNYWFTGTQVVSIPDEQLIKVSVAHKVLSATVSIASGFSQSGINLSALADGAIDPSMIGTPSTTYRFSLVGKKISVSIMNKPLAPRTLPAQSSWTISWTGTTAYAAAPNGDPFTVVKLVTADGSIQLKYGQIQLKVVAGKMEVIDTMTLEQYVLGISEMSSSWLPAALQAQAIASRTYGLAHLTLRSACQCNVYKSTSDQAYIGYAKESEPGVGANWKSAVSATETDSTHAQVIEYLGKPISVYFFASDGGRTQSSADVWGTAYPYLVSVPDPWSLDIFLNPQYAHWQRVLIQKDVASAFNLPDVISLAITARTTTNSATIITATSIAGLTSQLTVGAFKSKLRIPASWFEIAPNTY